MRRVKRLLVRVFVLAPLSIVIILATRLCYDFDMRDKALCRGQRGGGELGKLGRLGIEIGHKSWWAGEKDRTYATLERAPIHVVTVQLADGGGGVLVSIHLDEGETAISLEARLEHIAKVLEQGHDVVLGGVGGEIPDVASGLPRRSLVDDHIVAVDAVRGEVVVAEGGGGGHAHLLHGLLLGNRGLALLVGPIAANSSGAEPLAVHRAESLLGVRAIAEGDEAVTTGAAGLHIPHHSGLGYGPKGRESLG